MSDSIKTPVNFTFNIGTHDKTSGEDEISLEGTPYSIAIVGDFSGYKNTPAADSGEQQLFKAIDSYDYDEVLASYNINLKLEIGDDAETIDVPVRKFKDFHPDQLYKNVSVFETLRDLRQRLQNNSTFNEAAEQIQGWLVPRVDQDVKVTPIIEDNIEKTVDNTAPVITENMSSDNLLDSILEATDMQSSAIDDSVPLNDKPSTNEPSLVEGFVKQMMANRVSVSSNPRQDEMLAAIDESISELMRSILHHPDFQAVESSWQAIRFMVRRIKSGKNIKFYLLDVSKQALEIDLANEDVTQSAFYAHFCDAAFGDIKWNLIVGDYRFSDDINDILLLSQLGFIAQKAGATFISAADEKLIGCESFATTPAVNRWDYELDAPVAEAWALLRQSEVAKHLSLALPSFLIREPYSSVANPIKSFAFEEMPLPVIHADYLWANAAFLKAEQLARAFAKKSWNMRPGEEAKTEDLPMHSYTDKGKTVIQPCAEIALTDTAAVLIQEQGIIPLWSIKNTDRVHSGEFYTLAYS